MYDLVAVGPPLLPPPVAVPLPAADPVASLQWLHVWLPATGLLGMGLRDVLGGGGSDGSDDPQADPLGEGFGSDLSADENGFDDDLDDGLGADFDEVEPRLDDFEAELEELSNTVSSVHSDNEEVRESLGEIEDNVRKLLEVYEVVTQGANPFADEPAALGGTAGESGAFGLFEDDDDDGSDDAVDPEALFDDGPSQDQLAEAIDDGSGLTFDDLKSEFDFVGDEAPEALEGGEGPPPEDGSPDVDPGDGTDASEPAAGSPGKPYLRALPGGFGAELLVMEWLDYLVSESSVPEAMRAVRYYGTVEWISEEVAAHLQTVLSGTSPRRELAATDGGRPTELSVDHHTESLEYVSQLRALDEGAPPLRESPGHRVGEYGHPEEDHGVQR